MGYGPDSSRVGGQEFGKRLDDDLAWRAAVHPDRSLFRIADALETIADELRRRPLETPGWEAQAAAGVDVPGGKAEQGEAGDAARGSDRAAQAEGTDE